MGDEKSKPKGFLTRYGGRLIANGYEIIPIRPGKKSPPGDNWQKIRANPARLKKWLDNGLGRYGVGILTRKAPFVDLDILDEAGALHMEAFVREQYGEAPLRIGHAPKRGLLFRADEPFPKVNSKTFEDEWGDPELTHSQAGKPTGHLRKVEILGDGQQFVAYHVHPETHEPYRWIANGNPITVAWEDLPVLDHDGAKAIAAEFDRYAEERGWTIKTQSRQVSRLSGRSAGPASEDVFAYDKAKTELSADELRRKLLLVPNADEYDTWFQVGMALYHQFDGEQEGLDLWHEWSETATNYNADALEKRWATFDDEGKGREPLTARFILKLAQEQQQIIAVETFRDIREEITKVETISELAEICKRVKNIEFDLLARNQLVGIVKDRYKKITDQVLPMGVARDMLRYEAPTVKEAPHWLKGWVYVTLDKTFYNMQTHQHLSTEAFNAVFSRFMLTKTEVLEGKSVPETLPQHFALNNVQIPIVRNRMYLPGHGDLFKLNSVDYVNRYSELNVPDTPGRLNAEEREALETIKAHMENLFPDEFGRRVFLDALAYIVQNPTERLTWAILLQGTQGDGKTFFAGLLAAALGPDNVMNMVAQSMEEKYNAWAEGAQVVFFEEIKLHGHNRFDVLNKVKPLLTNKIVPIRRMNTDPYNVVNTVSYILTTNFRDALPLDDDESRYLILFSRFQTKPALVKFKKANPGYYKRLYATLEHAGAIRKWLLNHRISADFEGKDRAPDTKARLEMIRYAKSDERLALEELIGTSPHVYYTTTLLDSTKLADDMAGMDCQVPYGRAMTKLLLDAGFTKIGKVRIGTETNIFWTQEPERFINDDGSPNAAAVRAWLDSDL